jgi:LmbE family N-acetylglucosaminyl deacetylase
MTLAGKALSRMRALPIRDARGIAGDDPVLVLAPHADDEVLGCAGLILGLLEAAIPVSILFVTDGTGSHPASRDYPPIRLRALREAEALAAARVLGVPAAHVGFLRCRDTAAPHRGRDFDVAVARIADWAARFGCRTICAPWRHDPHCDHLAAHLMAGAAARQVGARHLAYPVWGWTLPDDTRIGRTRIEGARLRLGLAAQRKKRRALVQHASQLGQVVTDDPTGFSLDEATLRQMIQPFEVFLSTP